MSMDKEGLALMRLCFIVQGATYVSEPNVMYDSNRNPLFARTASGIVELWERVQKQWNDILASVC